MPTSSAFARIFQFGMRLGMRSYTLGSAWWQGDCGPNWGHNVLIRTEPFRSHCMLPELPGRGPLSGPILSHDQLEAVMIRRAGYEVRVMAEESQSFEELLDQFVPCLPCFYRSLHKVFYYLSSPHTQIHSSSRYGPHLFVKF